MSTPVTPTRPRCLMARTSITSARTTSGMASTGTTPTWSTRRSTTASPAPSTSVTDAVYMTPHWTGPAISLKMTITGHWGCNDNRTRKHALAHSSAVVGPLRLQVWDPGRGYDEMVGGG